MEIAICDDNEICLLELEQQLKNISLVNNIYSFSNLTSFISSVQNGNLYDAVLMDINWGPNSAGIDTASQLFNISPQTKIIYVTGFGEHYSQSIFLHSTNLSGFLTKPVNFALLKANIEKVEHNKSLEMSPSIALKNGKTINNLSCSQIFLLESRARVIEIYLKDGIETSYGKLEDFLEILPNWFIQCHKSFVVNMRQIQRISPTEILLKNGLSVPVSRSRLKTTKEAYLDFIGNTL